MEPTNVQKHRFLFGGPVIYWGRSRSSSTVLALKKLPFFVIKVILNHFIKIKMLNAYFFSEGTREYDEGGSPESEQQMGALVFPGSKFGRAAFPAEAFLACRRSDCVARGGAQVHQFGASARGRWAAANCGACDWQCPGPEGAHPFYQRSPPHRAPTLPW